MHSRWLILALVASLALNLFLIGAGAGVIALGVRMARENGVRPAALAIATRDMPQPDRMKMRDWLRQTRTQTEADVNQSRELRIEAWGALADPKPDPAAIKSKLAQSRQLDIGVRTKVEEEVVDYVADLPPGDRTAFALGMRHVLTPPQANAPPPNPPAAKP